MNNCYGLSEYSPYYFGARPTHLIPLKARRRRASPKRRRASPKKRITKAQKLRKLQKLAKKNEISIYKIKKNGLPSKQKLSLEKLKARLTRMKVSYFGVADGPEGTRLNPVWYPGSKAKKYIKIRAGVKRGSYKRKRKTIKKKMTKAQKLRKLHKIAKKNEISIYKNKKNGLPSKQKLSLEKLKARLTRMKVPYDKKMFR